MQTTSGKIQDLNEGSSEVLQALLSSISSGTTGTIQPGNLTSDAIKNLTERLGELLGDDAVRDFNENRNERGELVNEEGLPVVDITEPLSLADEQGSGDTLTEELPVPITTLPPHVRERWKQERERILDILQEEERLEQLREGQVDLAEREAILSKRKEAAAREKEKMKATKAMQKKMGKALVGNMSEPREGVIQPKFQAGEEKTGTKSRINKKTVAFALEEETEGRDPIENSRSLVDWGDVTPARLQATATKPSFRLSETLPMKMSVVERLPANQSNVHNVANNLDSDDESEPENFINGDDFDDTHSPIGSGSDEDPALEDEEFDINFAQHQREIALEYHEKRSTIGKAALAAMSSHSYDDDPADVPFDMPSSKSKPSVSRFKAGRIASSYGASVPSTSMPLGTSSLPTSSARTIQKAIRLGKLDEDGRLVGGDMDSASEDEALIHDALKLRKGEVHDLGPDGNYIHTTLPRDTSGAAPIPSPLVFNTLPPLNKPKTSKFKLSRSSQTGRPTNAEKALPKSMGTPVAEHMASGLSPSSVHTTSLPVTSNTNTGIATKPTSMPSMIVESPSFPRPTLPSTVISSSPSPAATTSRPRRPPVVLSSVVKESNTMEPTKKVFRKNVIQ